MKIIYFGNNQRGHYCLEAILKAGFNVCAVVVHPNTAISHPYSLNHLADSYKISVFAPQDVNSFVFVKKLKSYKPDLFVLSGYNPILRKEILTIPLKGAINLHGGRLPHYRGGSPTNWQIINGEKQGACTILYVDEGIDTGNILSEEIYDIGADATAGEISAKMLTIFPRLLIKTLKLAEKNSLHQKKQGDGIYYCKRYPHDGKVFWEDMTSIQVHNLVRGLNGPDLPGAYCFLEGKKIILWKTSLLKEDVRGPAGRIALRREDGVIVIAKDRGLLLKQIILNKNGEIIPAQNLLKIRGLSFT